MRTLKGVQAQPERPPLSGNLWLWHLLMLVDI